MTSHHALSLALRMMDDALYPYQHRAQQIRRIRWALELLDGVIGE